MAKTGNSAPLAIVTIALFKARRIELFELQECPRSFCQKHFLLRAFSFQGKKIRGHFAAGSDRPAMVLSEHAKVVVYGVPSVFDFLPLDSFREGVREWESNI